MTNNQQQETLEYFRQHAGGWKAKADGVGAPRFNIIEQRNAFVLMVAGDQPSAKSILDIGCGTGELICLAAKRGMHATGVDYAPEMIALASTMAADQNIPGANFVCQSIFDFAIPAAGYDVISANGFIEYISLEQLRTLVQVVANGLKPGGSFVVGSRNRLFNLMSMNAYTVQEIESGELPLLLQEAIQWNAELDVARVVTVPCASLQAPETEHAKTGIDVTTRFQYTPFQLINLLNECGLHSREVYPVHVHSGPPSFAKQHPDQHVSVANALQHEARGATGLLPHASTFMLHAVKSA